MTLKFHISLMFQSILAHIDILYDKSVVCKEDCIYLFSSGINGITKGIGVNFWEDIFMFQGYVARP